jgi:putative inorganic carbon (HCO3(-)) transporter
MAATEPVMLRAARYLTFGSAVSILFSIAVCQILLALAFAALLVSGAKLRLPRIWLPLSLFLLGTLVSLALSGDFRSGLPQVRKIFVYVMLLAVFSTLRGMEDIRRLFLTWAGVGALVALRGLVQFGDKLHEAHLLGRNFYDYYVAERITGFMSHWMTFGGQEMFVLLMLAAFLFFAADAGKRWLWVWLLCAAVLLAALVLGFTRSIWLATGAGGLYLLWMWKRRFAVIIPVALLAALLVAPASVQARFSSLFRPRKDVDSNQHRMVTWRTGLKMIRAHPWFGLGPEQVKIQFDSYVPPDVRRPLPVGWYGHLHNIYLHYAAERGLPVMLVLVWMLLRIVYDFARSLRRAPPGRTDLKFVLRGGIAVVISTMVAGCFELNLGDSEVLTMFLVVVACGYAAIDAYAGAARQEAVLAA